ncbi:hypothetical protein HDU88_001857 [Geranomyces variabilis]|nr:hypothetical protein HDU88_001857 [Geranomyces variabilis]
MLSAEMPSPPAASAAFNSQTADAVGSPARSRKINKSVKVTQQDASSGPEDETAPLLRVEAPTDSLPSAFVPLEELSAYSAAKGLSKPVAEAQPPSYLNEVGPAPSHAGIVIGLTVLALIVRLFQISNPSEVVFDEVHFGGFAAKYINGTFFMDVHPPLGKMMIAASGYLAGFDGTFDFKEIGKDYIAARVPYISMRLLPGILGCLIVPMSYLTMRNLRASTASSVMTALMVAFDNALAAQSRLILLDSILVFFTALSVQMWTRFQSVKNRPFTLRWWTSLALSGAAIGLATSVKWVGLFVIAWVGFSTVKYLWDLLGNTSVNAITFFKHFAALALCLIVVPAAIYMAAFRIHFAMLPKIGSGTGFMSPEFQSTLKGSEIKEAYAEVGFGARVMVRHENTQGGYIHSHKHFYPTGSKQQQITLYPYADANSLLRILPALEFQNETAISTPVTEFRQIKHGDIIRLEHDATNMRLHSHDQRPPVTDVKGNFEVSGYGAPGFMGDSNDHWQVELHDYKPEKPYLTALQKFRLIHVNTGCALFSHAIKLPEWGFGQQEVLCANNGKKSLTTWRIDSNENQFQPKTSIKIGYKRPSFLEKFIESHRIMWRINSGLDGTHPFQSRPQSWPVIGRTISFWSSKTGPEKMHLIGNPIVWAAAFAALAAYAAVEAVGAVLWKRRMVTAAGVLSSATRNAGLLFVGWLLHYAPFFLMGRQLFLHHYLPSLYFSILLAGVLFDGITRRAGQPAQWALAVAVAIVAAYTFTRFAPLTYARPMSKEACMSLKWRKSWDWDCK